MIGGATRGSGGPKLARHLADQNANDSVEAGPVRGLLSDPDNTHALQRELERIQAHVRTRRPIHHVHCDPPPGLSIERSAEVREAYWKAYELEFGFESAPFYSRIHIKKGRVHEHRVYGLGQPDGRVADLSFDYARREKVARLIEFEQGLPWTVGKHTRAVVAAFEREGRLEIAEAMRVAGLDRVARPVAFLSPRQRAQGVRTGVDMEAVASTVLAGWLASADAAAFAALLAADGLRLARGQKALVIVDASGNGHPLAAMIGKASSQSGCRVAASAVHGRLSGFRLETYQPGAGSPTSITVEAALHQSNYAKRDEAAQPHRLIREQISTDPTSETFPLENDGSAGSSKPQEPLAGGVKNAVVRDQQDEQGLYQDPGEVRRHGRRHARRSDPKNSHTGIATIIHFGVSDCSSQESDDERRTRRDRWFSAASRGGYHLRWVPPSIAPNIVRVEVDQKHRAVVLILRSGTRIVDRQTRLDIGGLAGDVTARDMVIAVQRRGWTTVRLHGDLAFQHAVTIRLQRLKPPIAIADSLTVQGKSFRTGRHTHRTIPAAVTIRRG